MKSIYHLEQLFLQHHAHQHAAEIKQKPNGLDFAFESKTAATAFTEFV
jgi:hypothetical protein